MVAVKTRRAQVRIVPPIKWAACAIVATGLAGCPIGGPPATTGFAETKSVPVAGGKTVEVPLGAGCAESRRIHVGDSQSR